MTSPDRFIPPNGNPGDVEATRIQGLFANGLKDPGGALLGPVVAGISGAIRDLPDLAEKFVPVRDAVRAFIQPVTSRLDVVEGDQLDHAERLDLLDGVRGYCAAYQTVNINLRTGTNNRRVLPFTSQIGPAKGAEVYAPMSGIRFLEPGLWTIHVLAHARNTLATPGFGVPDTSEILIRVMDSGVMREAVVTAYTYSSAASLTASIPMVITSAGATVQVEAWSSRWRWINGGTKYSRLAVVKHDSRVEHIGQETVPDE